MITKVADLVNEVQATADDARSDLIQFELVHKVGGQPEKVRGDDGWYLFLGQSPYGGTRSVQISEPLAQELQTGTWWLMGQRKAARTILKAEGTRSPDTLAGMCECGHWVGNHVRGGRAFGYGKHSCHGTNCKCPGFKTAGL